MPPVVGAVAAGVIAGASGATIFGLTGLAAGLAVAGLSLGLSLITQSLAPDVSFSIAARDRSLTVRATAEPRTLVFGETALGGQLALFETTGASRQFLHITEAHADHPCDRITGWFANDERVGPLDSAGNVTGGRFAGHLRLVAHLGGFDQAAAANLLADVPGWSESDQGGGVTYTEARLKYSADVWPNGFTGLRAVVRGIFAYDPRDAGVTITASDTSSPSVFETDGAHGRSVGDNVWIKDHAGALLTIGGQEIRFTGRWHEVASVPTTTSLTLLDQDGQPVTFTTAGTGGTVTPMAWTDNWALLVRMFLTHRAVFDAQDDEIDDTVLAAAANICDEQVALTPEARGMEVLASVVTADPGNDLLMLATEQPFNLGHPVRIASTGTPPAPLVAGTVYYSIPSEVRQLRTGEGVGAFPQFEVVAEGIRLATSLANAEAGTFITLTDAGTGVHTLVDGADRIFLPDGATWKTGDAVEFASSDTLPAGIPASGFVIRQEAKYYQIATSLENARALVTISITDAGAGTHTATRQSQVRYRCNGVVRLGEDPHRALDALMTAAAGVVVREGGMVKLYAGAATTATGATGASDLRDADLEVVPFLPRADIFNAVRGTFVDPDKFWTEGDAPPYTNALYRAQDNGELIFRDLRLPFTTDPVAAQRLFKIALERARQGATLKAPAKPRKYGTAVWDVEPVTIDHLGYAAKEFRVMSWAEREDFGVDLVYREESPTAYDWNLGDETTIDPAPNSNLPDPLDIDPPGGLAMAEELYETRDGSGVKARAVLTWMDAANIFVSDGGGYQLAYKLTADTEFIVRPMVTEATDRIDDIAPGLYEFKVRSISVLAVKSAYGPVLTQNVFALSAAPAAPQDLTISAIGGLALLRWRLADELDVREGGEYRLRHSPLFSGATWPASASIAGIDGEAIDGKQTSANLPLKPGTYLVRAFDSSGIPSAAVASVTTKQATALAYTDTDTLAEHPSWLGTHNGTAAPDSVLMLDGATTVDSFGLVDQIANWDSEGGVLGSGIYTFAGNFDFLLVVRRRLTVDISVLVLNTLDTIDSRTTNVDTWESIDGINVGSADAVVWVRHTDDDPAGSPVWTAYERLDSAEFQARAFQFQARLSSTDPSYNIEVSALTITAAEVA